MMTNRPEHQLPINAVEIGVYVDVEHPVIPPAALTSLAHGIDRRFAGPVAIRVGMKHRLQTRLQVTTDNFLGDTVDEVPARLKTKLEVDNWRLVHGLR
jgi:hypothetical protein